MDDLEQAAALVAGAATIAVLTGAGISTDSGIPDYRGPQGTWTKDPEAERIATLDHYLGDPQVRRRAWKTRITSPIWSARPNAGHLAIASLERSGRLRAVITQNVDGLHQQAGNDPDLVIELHGTAHWATCWSCGDRRPMPELLARVRAGEEDPACELCGGIVKSATISFGQNLDLTVLARAQRVADDVELLVVAGSTLQVHPAASLVPRAVRNGARLIIANAEPTQYDGLADVVLNGGLSEVLPAVVPSA